MDWLIDGESHRFISYLLLFPLFACISIEFIYIYTYRLKSAITIMTLATISFSQLPSKLFFTS